MRDNKRGTIEDRAYVARVLEEQPSVRADILEQDAGLGPQSPQEARIDAAISESMDFAAWRVFVTMLDKLTPLVAEGMTAEEILGTLVILRDEYAERYKAHRG